MQFDTLIINGTIIDGACKPKFKSDIGIVNGKIDKIGQFKEADAKRVIKLI